MAGRSTTDRTVARRHGATGEGRQLREVLGFLGRLAVAGLLVVAAFLAGWRVGAAERSPDLGAALPSLTAFVDGIVATLFAINLTIWLRHRRLRREMSRLVAECDRLDR